MPGREHRRRGAHARAPRRLRRRKRSRPGSSTAITRPGLVQNCPAPIVSEPTNASAERVRAPVQRGGQQRDRIDAAHLGIDRDRLGPRGRDAHQREAAAARAGEADRLDARIGDQRVAELDCPRRAGARTCPPAGRTPPRPPESRARRARDVPGMGRVALDDHRAAGGQRRGGVAAGDREGEREVARAEHGHRAERRRCAGAGRGAAAACGRAGRGRCGASSQSPVAHDLREQPQLADGAAALALEPLARQAGLGRRALDRARRRSPMIVGDGLEERARSARVPSRGRPGRHARPGRKRAPPR